MKQCTSKLVHWSRFPACSPVCRVCRVNIDTPLNILFIFKRTKTHKQCSRCQHVSTQAIKPSAARATCASCHSAETSAACGGASGDPAAETHLCEGPHHARLYLARHWRLHGFHVAHRIVKHRVHLLPTNKWWLYLPYQDSMRALVASHLTLLASFLTLLASFLAALAPVYLCGFHVTSILINSPVSHRPRLGLPSSTTTRTHVARCRRASKAPIPCLLGAFKHTQTRICSS